MDDVRPEQSGQIGLHPKIVYRDAVFPGIKIKFSRYSLPDKYLLFSATEVEYPRYNSNNNRSQEPFGLDGIRVRCNAPAGAKERGEE